MGCPLPVCIALYFSCSGLKGARTLGCCSCPSMGERHARAVEGPWKSRRRGERERETAHRYAAQGGHRRGAGGSSSQKEKRRRWRSRSRDPRPSGVAGPVPGPEAGEDRHRRNLPTVSSRKRKREVTESSQRRGRSPSRRPPQMSHQNEAPLLVNQASVAGCRA